MRHKGILTLIVIVLVAMLCGCGEATPTQQKSNSSTDVSVTPVLSDENAKLLAENLMIRYYSLLEERVRSDCYKKASSIDNVKVATLTKKREYSSVYENAYEIVAKGTGSAYDDYGNYLGKFNFTWTMAGEYQKSGQMWWYKGQDKYSIRVSK